MTRQEKIEYIAALRERLIREARTDLLPFTRATMPTFDPAEFHVRYYHVLTLFAEGKIKKLMVFRPSTAKAKVLRAAFRLIYLAGTRTIK